MKMADGGFRPAYNVQLATDTETQLIVGVDVTDSGADAGELPPMLEQLEGRYERLPEEVLADTGFASHDTVDTCHERGVTLYAPVTRSRSTGRDPHQPRRYDSEAVIEWRARMGTERAKALYAQRAATAECVNALARQRGLQQFVVRGLVKVRAVALWHALAHNLLRTLSLPGPTLEPA